MPVSAVKFPLLSVASSCPVSLFLSFRAKLSQAVLFHTSCLFARPPACPPLQTAHWNCWSFFQTVLPSSFALRVSLSSSVPALLFYTSCVFAGPPVYPCVQTVDRKLWRFCQSERELLWSSVCLPGGRGRVQTAADKKRHLAEGTLPFLN